MSLRSNDLSLLGLDHEAVHLRAELCWDDVSVDVSGVFSLSGDGSS